MIFDYFTSYEEWFYFLVLQMKLLFNEHEDMDCFWLQNFSMKRYVSLPPLFDFSKLSYCLKFDKSCRSFIVSLLLCGCNYKIVIEIPLDIYKCCRVCCVSSS